MILVIVIYIATLAVIVYLYDFLIPKLTSELYELSSVVGIFLTILVPLLTILSSAIISYISKSIIVGAISYLSFLSLSLRNYRSLLLTKEYEILIIIVYIVVSVITFGSLYIISQFASGYLDSLIEGIKYKKNNMIATSLALSAVSVEVFNFIGLWKGNLLYIMLKALSVILTVFFVYNSNNVVLILTFSALSGIGWPITLFSSLFLSQQKIVLSKKSAPYPLLCIKGFNVIGLSKRTTTSRSVLRTGVFRWSLRSIECTSRSPLCFEAYVKRKKLFQVYGKSAKEAIKNSLDKGDVYVLCLSCDVDLWKGFGEVIEAMPETLDIIEEGKYPVVIVNNIDYLYSVAVTISRSPYRSGKRLAVIDGLEALLFNTKLFRAILAELIRSFEAVMIMADYMDYYAISDHVLRFPNVDSVYLIGNAKNIRVMKELLRDYIDSYVADDLIRRVLVNKNLLVILNNRAYLLDRKYR